MHALRLDAATGLERNSSIGGLRVKGGRASFPASSATDAQAPSCVPVHELTAPTMQPIDARHAHSRLWNLDPVQGPGL